MTDTLTKLTYQTLQQGKAIFGFAHKTISSKVQELVAPYSLRSTPLVPSELLERNQQLLAEIIETDWQDAERGVYPASLLFDNPWDDFWRYYPAVWLDLPQTWDRISQKQYQAFSPEIEQQGYPDYYLQNFHYQTDGYLSDMSANLYDLQVEMLFNGGADAMRRRVLAPLKEGLQGFESVPPQQIRVLDVACGTGRTLKMIRATLPKASLFGTDLSPAYLRKANRLLAENPGELPQLMQANAEELPYPDNYFHGVTSVFLFHELPPAARQHIIEQCFRVLQPGGVLIICDSIQVMDSPEMEQQMKNFPIVFHEPYYRHYMQDDLVERLETAGFEEISLQKHFVSKYWIAQKPE